MGKDTSLITCNNIFVIHWEKCSISFPHISCNCDLILLNHIMYLIIACILLHFYCMKNFMYMTVVMIVVGNNVLEPLELKIQQDRKKLENAP